MSDVQRDQARGRTEMISVIHPPDDSESKKALKVITEVGELLNKKKSSKTKTEYVCFEYFDQAMAEEKNKTTESVTNIQTRRQAIFLNADGKESTAFDRFLEMNGKGPEDKRLILQYAETQAQKELEESGDGREYEFGNFILIVSYGKVNAQARHMDVKGVNVQFSMMFTEGPGTEWYDVQIHIRNPEELENAWTEMDQEDKKHSETQKPGKGVRTRSRTGGTAMEPTMEPEPQFPKSLQNALRDENTKVPKLLKDYGDVLLPLEPEQCQTNPDLKPGTMLGLRGSVVHRGPPTLNDQARAVLFFSAWPKDSSEDPYDPNTQYGSVYLCGTITGLLWRHNDMDEAGRRYLLKKLYCYIRSEEVYRDWAYHFKQLDEEHFEGLGWKELATFVEKMENKETSLQNCAQRIQKAAKDEDFIPIAPPGTDDSDAAASPSSSNDDAMLTAPLAPSDSSSNKKRAPAETRETSKKRNRVDVDDNEDSEGNNELPAISTAISQESEQPTYDEVVEENKKLKNKIDELESKLASKTAEEHKELRAQQQSRLKEVQQQVNERLNEMQQHVNHRLNEVRQQVTETLNNMLAPQQHQQH